VARRVPLVRVIAGAQAEQRADRQRDSPRQRAGGEQLRCPVVVADAVDDREPGRGAGSRVGRCRLVAVGVGVRVDDDAPDRGLRPGQRSRDAPPEVLGGHHLQPGVLRTGAAAAAGQHERPEHGGTRTQHTAIEVHRVPSVDLTRALSPLPNSIEIQSYMRFRPAMLSGSPVCQPARARPLETRMYVTTRPEPIMARAATENFPVASRLLPARLRTHLLAIYGFARLADELGDEAPGDRLAALDWLSEELDRAFIGTATHPLLRALAPTIAACGL